ncbi:aldolase catalytic domain-containing protein [Wansuia hejianensis]|uniref:Aldolase catalytic domain-containing protein n=1 Tax=Wansuia hejianensis TaxID=2763667 RepID=A0A7G9GHE8_9FIRM|nr:aldolase catalytic domain-containing protein [Wansuia hejianensis]QNM10230.1 aldolase catalytic domain-containing protein [Wansuia hejianensis]RHV88520.1 hypothetical protein DXA96_11165 [Lachnospiraceae bacterium OF09-33XD]
MRNISLLDCTLRDGGYVNDWMFGEETIKGFSQKIAETGIEIFEVGFIKEDTFHKDRAVFPDIASIKEMIAPKRPGLMYVGMADMSSPVPIERFQPVDPASVDGIRVIFKKEKRDEAYEYCRKIKDLGYILFVQLVGTDAYTDQEFIETIEKFNALQPYALSIVDSFGLIKRKQFLRLVYLADHNLDQKIALGYHAHNNLQQAFGNAEALVDLGLQRDLCIDACVFGMGRGAGNLNMELFAEYMNENHGKNYRIEPMLEIMDEYLAEIYKNKFWGYSLPLYLSAVDGCHPNYAIYLAEKDTLTVKSFNELLRSIPKDDKAKFSKENAEKYYKKYQENFYDDKGTVSQLSETFKDTIVLLLAPGKSLRDYHDQIKRWQIEKCDQNEPVLVIAVNFTAEDYRPDFIFSSNMRRYSKIAGKTDAKCIITSNMKEAGTFEHMVNFASYSSESPEIIDNSGLMALKLLLAIGVKHVYVAGMDGYSGYQDEDYYDRLLSYDFSSEAERRNSLIGNEIKELGKKMDIQFLTPSRYQNIE